MRRRRLLALVGAGLVLSVFLLDWTVGALASPLSLRPQADARRVRANMVAVGGGLAHAPGLALGLQGHRLLTGPLGERIGDGDAAEPEDALRVLVLGGGATLGLGVADELTFARGIARAFAEAPEPGVLSGHWLPTFAPDVVLLCGPTVADAPGPLLRSIGAAGSPEPGFARRLWPWLWELDRVVGGEQHADVVTAPPPLGESEKAERLRSAVAACRDAGAEPIVVDLGGATWLQAIASELGARFVDAAPTAEVGAPVLADQRTGLLTRLGHDRVLQRLVDGLQAAGVLAPPR